MNLDCTLLSKEIRKRYFIISNAFYHFRNTPVSHRCIDTVDLHQYIFQMALQGRYFDQLMFS